MKYSILKLFAAVILGSVFLTACGGGSSGDGGGTENDQAIIISGVVTAPGGSIAALRQESAILIALRDSLFSPAHAALSGLQPVASVTVELAKIDNNGRKMGDELTTTTTNSNGEYQLTLPPGEEFSANLVVAVIGDKIALLAPVVDEITNINPQSRFVLNKLIGEGADLSKVAKSSVIELIKEVEELDLAAGSNLVDTYETLENSVGNTLEEKIAELEIVTVAEAGTGTDSGSDSATHSSTNTGSDSVADTGTNPGPDSGANPGASSGTPPATGIDTGSDNTPDNQTTAITIMGSVTAPGGSIAMLRGEHELLIAIRDFLFNKAHAKMAGLQAVSNADIELVRINNEGIQTGEVLASTKTDSSGRYELSLPADIKISGDLVVRLSGLGGLEMRAQVILPYTHINPISEFVLKKLIESKVDLSSLESPPHVSIFDSTFVFDLLELMDGYRNTLNAAQDLNTTLAHLENIAGESLEAHIREHLASHGAPVDIAGNYRLFELGQRFEASRGVIGQQIGASFHLYDTKLERLGDNPNLFEFNEFAGKYNSLTLTFNEERPTGDNLSIGNNPFSDEFPGYASSVRDRVYLISADNLLIPPSEPFLSKNRDHWQKTKAAGLFIGGQVHNFPDSVGRFNLFSTDLRFLVEAPKNMTTRDLDGKFGFVEFQTRMGFDEPLQVSTSTSSIIFDGAKGSLTQGERNVKRLGSQEGLKSETDAGSGSAIPFSISDNGKLIHVGDKEGQDSIISKNHDLMILPSATTIEGDGVFQQESRANIFVKLPTSQLFTGDKKYRFFFTGNSSGGDIYRMSTTSFDSILSINSDGSTGHFNARKRSASMVEGENPVLTSQTIDSSASIAVEADGTSRIEIESVAGGKMVLDGYLNHDGSVGIFASSLSGSNEGTDELGLVIAVEI